MVGESYPPSRDDANTLTVVLRPSWGNGIFTLE